MKIIKLGLIMMNFISRWGKKQKKNKLHKDYTVLSLPTKGILKYWGHS